MLGIDKLIMTIKGCLTKTGRRTYRYIIAFFIIWLCLTVIQVLKIIS